MGIASLIIGGILLLFAWLPFMCFISFLGGVVGLFLGIADWKAKKNANQSTTVPVIGVVMCSITLLMGLSCSGVYLLSAISGQ